MNEPRSGFPQKASLTPSITSQSTAKKKAVPKSANWKSGAEGDWGKRK